jgi:hypothetical protein
MSRSRSRSRSRARFGVAVAAVLAVVLTGCGGGAGGRGASGQDDGSGEGTVPSSTTRPLSGASARDGTGKLPAPVPPASPASPSATPSPTGESGAGDGSDVDACFDGRCELVVSQPVSIRFDSRFGVGDLRVTQITDDTVVLQSSGGGAFLVSSVGEGGTGSLNALGFRVKSLQGGTAVLEFFPRA